MYATADFICIGWIELLATRGKRELQNEKFLPKVVFEPTISRLLDWRSNTLSYSESDLRYLKVNDMYTPYYLFEQVQSKTRIKWILSFIS